MKIGKMPTFEGINMEGVGYKLFGAERQKINEMQDAGFISANDAAQMRMDLERLSEDELRSHLAKINGIYTQFEVPEKSEPSRFSIARIAKSRVAMVLLGATLATCVISSLSSAKTEDVSEQQQD